MIGLRITTCGFAMLAVAACADGGDSVPRPAPEIQFVAHPENPVFPAGPEGAWDDGLVDAGAVIFHSGRFHMLYNGIRDWPSPLAVGYATSTDGSGWTRRTDGPVFDREQLPYAAWGVRANSVLVEEDLWMLYFAVAPEEGRLDGSIGLATAASPEGRWEVHPEPILVPGPPGAWDGQSIGEAHVIPDAGGYVLFYTGRDADGLRRIGRAVSADGVQWTKYDDPETQQGPFGESDPVMGVGDGGWDGGGAMDPSVIRTADGGWLMVYRSVTDGVSGFGAATSGDGIRWTKARNNPVVTESTSDAWDFLFFNTLATVAGRQYLFFEAQRTGTDRTAVNMASRAVTGR